MKRAITSIEPSSKDPNLRDIYVDDVFLVSLPLARVVQMDLEEGKNWTEACESTIAMQTMNDKARGIALTLLARKAWGVNQLTTRLIKRGVEPNVAACTTEQLVEDGWLDDHVFASALIREWTRKEPAGRRWLEHKLREKEIPSEVASQVIDDSLGDSTEQARATTLALMKLSKLSSLDTVTVRSRVIAALGRRGFNSEVASEAIRLAQM